ncbi:MAG: phosphatase PAP2 family protein [Dokdonella sp.]
MSKRFLVVSALIAATLMIAGLLVVDRPLVLAIHASAFENLPFCVDGLQFLDTIFGMHVSYWLAPSVCLMLGLLALFLSSRKQLSRRFAIAVFSAGLVQAATIGLMMLGKNSFGRMRPLDLLASGDWSVQWFAGGGSFPSGHSSFYFGLFLPLAAAAPRVWQRIGLLVLPMFAISARLDTSKHFLSDVAASALVAACVALLVTTLLRRRLA